MEYPVHWAFHNIKSLARFHAKHHTMNYVRSTDALRQSMVDGAVHVLVSVASVNLSGAHPLSRAVYNVVVVYLLCEIHSGLDLPFMSHRVLPGVMGGSPYHALHHHASGSKHHYHQFFMYLDGILGYSYRPHTDTHDA